MQKTDLILTPAAADDLLTGRNLEELVHSHFWPSNGIRAAKE